MPRRVLIADDNDVVRGLIRSFLERRSNIEICAETIDGRATLDAALALRPDLLILDVVMPELNGLEVASLLKQRLPETKTILFTMYGEAIRNLALAAGVLAVLPKPDGIRPLLQVVDALLDRNADCVAVLDALAGEAKPASEAGGGSTIEQVRESRGS